MLVFKDLHKVVLDSYHINFMKYLNTRNTLAAYGNDSSPLIIPWTPSKTTLGELVYISLLTLSSIQASITLFVPAGYG